MGRLTLNVLLSFAQFEREVTAERIRDKIAASKRKGMWMGGIPPLGYQAHERSLVIDDIHATRVREIFQLHLELGCVRYLKVELDRRQWLTPPRLTRRADASGGRPFSRGHLYRILSNPVYLGQISHKGETFPGQHPAIIEASVWQLVQARLRANLQGERRHTNTIEPSLLAGLLFDQKGNRLTPSHARKRAKRYRYYVHRPKNGESNDPARRGLRWPAQELDDAILGALDRFLHDQGRLVELMGQIQPAKIAFCLAQGKRLAEQLSCGSSQDKIEMLNRIVSRIAVCKDYIEIAVRLNAICREGPMHAPEDSTVSVTVPIELKRCGMVVRLLIRAPGDENLVPDQTMVALLAKANAWLQLLISGDADSVLTIAKREKVTTSYVTRLIHLGCLSPDIVERILRGQHSPDLYATRLIRQAPLPLDWHEQKKNLGMAS